MKIPPLTVSLVVACVGAFLLLNTRLQDPLLTTLLISEYLRPALPEIRAGQVWRVFSPVLLHFGIFHVVFNMLWTWELGRAIEWHLGASSLALLTLAIAAISNLTQYYVSGPLFGGMSGVVYGYFGYLWIRGLTDPGFGMRLNRAVVNLMLGWFLLCWTGLLETLLNLQVANTAHTAGLIAGVVFALTASGLRRVRR